ncbi:MAG: hypothetical protein KC877_00085 [Candidatus Kaiserbacteria bacterium]|nr:hypothetical protein [Candidatus Kaiserbacteria bacterium]MCB9816628.1 hypothetical protein [Candidatus Nomurabacteria bacterium]
MKDPYRKILHAILLLPLASIAVIFFIRLFWLCWNDVWYVAGSIAAIALAWISADKLFAHTRSTTFIVLLCVLSVLVSMVFLSSQSYARRSGPDASIKQSLGNSRSQAELYWNKNEGSYSGVCRDETIQLLGLAAAENIHTNKNLCRGPVLQWLLPKKPLDPGQYACNDSSTEYAISAVLNVGSFWCVDSNGYAGEIPTAIGRSTRCQ